MEVKFFIDGKLIFILYISMIRTFRHCYVVQNITTCFSNRTLYY